ncbi:Uncharacterised protein [Chryseobacterium nakagawai]|nr:Uncharacterised protein [Chryseobacterium nakagawai]
MVSLKFKLLGTDIEQRILILIFKEFNYRVEILVGQNLRTEYLKRYKTSLNRIQEFIFWNISEESAVVSLNCFILSKEWPTRSIKSSIIAILSCISSRIFNKASRYSDSKCSKFCQIKEYQKYVQFSFPVNSVCMVFRLY